ncbi:uncharacterized protein LOC119577560 [Penaeus monodon]|uniref:uncharacterized protein LOC119577560 n=1 Tax=Penaeus monodon TaxID=6687 RepID=UPI0018A73592|nr:uncharacterized protein LOC119577560 [Penaeus monodon]
MKLHAKTDKLPSKRSVRQGDTISPILFTAFLEEIFKMLEWNGKGFRIGDEHLNNLRFPDGIALFGESANELQQLINSLNRETLKVGLKNDMKKTKAMFNSRIQFEQIHSTSHALISVIVYEIVHRILKTYLILIPEKVKGNTLVHDQNEICAV